MPWYVCLGTMSKDFIKDEQSETSLNGTVYSFLVGHRPIEKEEYMMKRNNIK